MSFTSIESCSNRLQRSQLAVPASNPSFIDKAARSNADAVFLDLEDAIAVSEKSRARELAVQALNDLDWGNKTLQVRINALDTEYMYRDVVDIVERCPRLDMLVLPKIGIPADVYALDMLVSQIEWAMSRTKRISFDVLIETAQGMTNVEAIAACSPRIESLSFGVGDFAASTGARSTVIGGVSHDYGVLTDPAGDGARQFHPGDLWQYGQSRVLVACRSRGLRPMDGPFGDFSDATGFEASARRSAALGYEGKWVIHPNQIELANQVFSPTDEEVAAARRIADVMQDAERHGAGAVSLDGKLVDIASIKMAENVLRKAALVGART